jgi:hypothetical protein
LQIQLTQICKANSYWKVAAPINFQIFPYTHPLA